jgi:2-oxoglutarate dehydrogenase E1 component
MNNPTFATHWNAELIDEYYQDWLNNPDSVDSHWQAFFEGFELGESQTGQVKREDPQTLAAKQTRVDSLIYAYRSLGHTLAKVDPLQRLKQSQPRLELSHFDLTEEDLEETFQTGHLLHQRSMKLKEIIELLKRIYCGSVGIEYVHIQETEVRRWIQDRIEPTENRPEFENDKKIRILTKILEAESFEQFLHTRYLGQKRFSLEGAETLIAALDGIVQHTPVVGVEEIVVGMAHRGRLNVLANILQKSYEFVFQEFSENYMPNTAFGDGDVKYHLGFHSIITTQAGTSLEIQIAANPSHLEAVDPVVQGKVRARQRIRGDVERKRVLPILIHGDAAFAGQGVVAETLNFSQLKGYRTGGTVHIIVNNQIGFTTLPHDARSSLYATDVAKMIEAPIFHVNGDDPLSVVMVSELALEFRQKFQRDVVIDMYCYRKHGHNETDEPAFTQPTLYKNIGKHKSISQIMSESLISGKSLTPEQAKQIESKYRETLEKAFSSVKEKQEATDQIPDKKAFIESMKAERKRLKELGTYFSFDPVSTQVNRELLKKVVHGLTTVPEDFNTNSKIKRLIDGRRKAFETDEPIDWAFAESLAFGTLLAEGTPVRLSGQDSRRGTFSQRHSVFYDEKTRKRFIPLKNIDKKQAQFCVYNSTLSEAAVLGFDYGYSLDFPDMLCLWEAQFGDFVNGAQVIIDQFITSSETKWQRVSGIVMLLPHGYEGQGPEHSSARMERFLQAGAENNIQVCNLTTPAQYFHLLRRQMRRNFRKPLIIMAPKSMLRNKDAVSPFSDLENRMFEEIIDDSAAPQNPSRLILCSGKVYWDLYNHRLDKKLQDTAIVRVEQLYPLHKNKLLELSGKYSDCSRLVWCQEEPQNMGAWSFIAPRLEDIFKQKPAYAGRSSSASTAVGSLALHKYEQSELVEQAFTI